MSRMGRKPQGAALVGPLAGSEHAKRRMTWFLQTLGGQCDVAQACQELGIRESRFFAQRSRWLQQALRLLEPRSPGRPPKSEETPEPEELRLLREKVGELEARAAAAEVRAELARVLPHVIHSPRAGKKTTRTAPRRCAPVSRRPAPVV